VFSFFWVVARRTLVFADVSEHRNCPIFVAQDAQDAISTLKGRTYTMTPDVGNNPTPPSNPEV